MQGEVVVLFSARFTRNITEVVVTSLRSQRKSLTDQTFRPAYISKSTEYIPPEDRFVCSVKLLSSTTPHTMQMMLYRKKSYFRQFRSNLLYTTHVTMVLIVVEIWLPLGVSQYGKNVIISTSPLKVLVQL